jgi:hypothetical protein
MVTESYCILQRLPFRGVQNCVVTFLLKAAKAVTRKRRYMHVRLEEVNRPFLKKRVSVGTWRTYIHTHIHTYIHIQYLF